MGRIFEVTPDKELVWEYVSPFYYNRQGSIGWNNSVFRAYRYAPDYEGLKGKTLNAENVELTLREKPGDKERALQKRLGRLGY